MMPKYLSAFWVAIAPALGNHLWQSTLSSVLAGGLRLTLRQTHARARYALWLVARNLDVRNKLLLGAAGFLAVAAPIGFGWAHSAHAQDGQAIVPQSSASAPAANALATTAKFEVASIKRAKPTGPRVMFRIMNSPNDGRFYASGPTVKLLLRIAYDVQDSQIVGGPGWISSDRFDIQAKADSSVDDGLRKLSPEQAKLVKEHMLQDLLADRFKLMLHH